jgi:hypothetical protein
MIKDHKALYGDELLVAAFAQLGDGATFKVVDTSDIVRAFYEIKSQGNWSNLFINYPFDTDGIEPRSIEMTEGIEALQQTRLLGRQNPDLVKYTVSPAVRVSYERFIKPKLRGKEPLVRRLAERLRTQLHVSIEPSNVTTTNREVRRPVSLSVSGSHQ